MNHICNALAAEVRNGDLKHMVCNQFDSRCYCVKELKVELDMS